MHGVGLAVRSSACLQVERKKAMRAVEAKGSKHVWARQRHWAILKLVSAQQRRACHQQLVASVRSLHQLQRMHRFWALWFEACHDQKMLRVCIAHWAQTLTKAMMQAWRGNVQMINRQRCVHASSDQA
jgi:GTP1/Obg family GTP-binding protein